MPLQKRGNGWRARRKKGSKMFHGPTRTTEGAAMQDAQELDAAAAVSMERLQEVHDRLIGVLLGAPAASATGAFAPSMSVQKIYRSWHARRKMGSKTFNGSTRHTEAAANEDAQLLEEAAAVSIERLQEVHDRLTSELHASVAKHRSGWRVRVTVGREKICGPTRQGKGEAEEACLRLRGLQHMSTAGLQNAVANMHSCGTICTALEISVCGFASRKLPGDQKSLLFGPGGNSRWLQPFRFMIAHRSRL